MGQEAKIIEFEANGRNDEATATATGAIVDDDDDDVNDEVLEWELGLPNCDDLTTLSDSLIPPELASAFSISPEPCRTAIDVNRASQDTLSSLRSTGAHSSTTNSNNNNFRSFNDPMVVEQERAAARLMNVEGLTRENVASHLQKYRVYLKRMQGLSNGGPTASDQLFASTPIPQSIHENGTGVKGGGSGSVNSNGRIGMAIPMPYGAPMIPVPMYGPVNQGGNHHQNGYEANSYGMLQQRDWSGGNKYGSVGSYPHHL
ncbi:Detected protein of unknown function [Hibiscus syriacus]|uniref:Uncharacterized protein n=1 Tax=Hibiscus syriacus TaxID=106335 RepID=A0A6A3CPF9_HIBSY|nr:Detected protein of unknown function [Hibiscus syriacus]